MRNAIILVCLVIVSSSIIAQPQIEIKGNIIDKNTDKSIPFVFFRLKNSPVGGYSNEEGTFNLKISEKSKWDSIIFSCMGYTTVVLPIYDLVKTQTIKLHSNPIQLKEIVFTATSPEFIINEAVRRIPQNYHTDTTLNTFFYRDWRTVNDSLCVFAESILDIIRVGYGKYDEKMIKFRKDKRLIESNYKKTQKYRLLVYDTTIVSQLQLLNNMKTYMKDYDEVSTFQDWVEMSNASYALGKKFQERYTYSLSSTYDSNTHCKYYIIEMEAKPKYKKQSNFKLLIKSDDYAIIKIEFYPPAQIFSNKVFKLFKVPNKVQNHGNQSVSMYEKVNGKYTLVFDKHLINHTFWNANEDTSYNFKSIRIFSLIDFKDTNVSPFFGEKIIEPKKQPFTSVFSNNTNIYDNSFWEQYNYIPLEENIKHKVNAALTTQQKLPK